MKLLFNLKAIVLFAMIIATTGASAGLSIFGAVALSFVSTGGAGAYSGLNKEIWLAEIKEGFYADDMWISECRDMSAFVENDIINLSEAGVNPDVLINNTVYPIAVSERPDGALALELNRFDTENTSLKDADRVELAYDKLTSIIYGHKQALKMGFMEKGAHSIAPAANSTYTPLLTTSGADDGNGYKKMTFSDIRRMRTAFNNAEIPAEGRVMILTATHEGELEDENRTLFNQMLDKGTIYGFKVYTQAEQRLPKYETTTDTKVAYGAASTGTQQTATLFFQKDEVMKAVGSDQMYHAKAENDPQNRQDVVGFSRRGLIIPIRNKGVGAIYKTTVA